MESVFQIYQLGAERPFTVTLAPPSTETDNTPIFLTRYTNRNKVDNRLPMNFWRLFNHQIINHLNPILIYVFKRACLTLTSTPTLYFFNLQAVMCISIPNIQTRERTDMC